MHASAFTIPSVMSIMSSLNYSICLNARGCWSSVHSDALMQGRSQRPPPQQRSRRTPRPRPPLHV
jgi:hypothetical protein